MKEFKGFMHGIGIGGWLTNYRRLRYVPEEWRENITVGDIEHFDSYITEKDIRQIASWGCDHVRLAFDYLIIEDPKNHKHLNPWGFCYLDRCLKWCRKYNLNVIFDLHRADGAFCDITGKQAMFNDPQMQERFLWLWRQMAEHFKEEKERVVFELLNEVDTTGDKWNGLVLRAVDAIHEIDPDCIIMVGGNKGASIDTLKAVEQVPRPNVVYTFHCYEPFLFTHQKAIIIPLHHAINRTVRYPDSMAPLRESSMSIWGHDDFLGPFERFDREYLYSRLAIAEEFMTRYPNAIVTLGEFGTINHVDITSRENYYRDVIDWCRARGIGYTAWNYLSTPYDANRFGVINDWTRRPLSRKLAKIIGSK